MCERRLPIERRGFNGWQQERWLVHCEDACAFLGSAGKDELEGYADPELIESLRADIGMDELKFRDYFKTLSKHARPTAYVFRWSALWQVPGIF